MMQLPDIKKLHIDIDNIENSITAEKNISLSVLRLDKIHNYLSGNKLFKLYYFLEAALKQKAPIITFGGAYSNHLAATAFACNAVGLKCTGIVRGDEIKPLNLTLQYCQDYGMHLAFVSREDYKRKEEAAFLLQLQNDFGEHILIPEGGYGNTGRDGASLITEFYYHTYFDYICCSIGTATTFAGLITSSPKSQKVIGFNALKPVKDLNSRINKLVNHEVYNNYSLINEYNFGGYAKKTDELLVFINKFYEDFAIPLDFIYTGKMMFGIMDMIKKKYFNSGSKILCIHTGGLQGNLSLDEGILNFGLP